MKSLLLILAITTLFSCSKHSIITKQETSRHLTIVEFSASKKPYYAKQQIGGEQINMTTIKAKAGESYLIEIIPENQSLKFYIDGSSLVNETMDNNLFKKKVTTQTQSDIDISFTSHPNSGFYELKIKKL